MPAWVVLAATAACMLLTAALLLRHVRLGTSVRESGNDIGAAAARYGEAQRMLRQRHRIQDAQRLAEGAVEGTTRTVEDIHRGIASIPFEVLDGIPATRDTARIVREIHDLTSTTVYTSIRAVNRLVGSGTRQGLRLDAEAPKKDRDSHDQ